MIIRAEEVASLRHCLEEISPRDRVAVELHYLQGLSEGVLAGILNVTTLNARQILYRARRQLRRCLERVWGEPWRA